MASELDQDFAFSDENVIGKIAAADSLINMYLDSRYSVLGVKDVYHLYITVIVRNPGVHQRELASKCTINASNVTRALMQLEKDGFIYRVRDKKDRRGWLLYPTEKAAAIYDKLVTAFDDLQAKMLSAISEEERRQLVQILPKIVNKVKELREEEI